jgi:tetratricopeptide (TPR) repeat protein
MELNQAMFHSRCIALFVLGAALAAEAQPAQTPIASIESLIRSKQYDRALQAAQSALQKKPNDFRLWTLEGIVLSIKGNNQDAVDAFQKALNLSPNYPVALKGEVQLFYQAQDKRAIPLLERILKADPKDEIAQEMLANLEEKQGNCEDAIDHFRLSAEVLGTHPHSLEAYGYCFLQTKQPQKAIPVFEQLAALLPERTYPKYDLAVVLVEAKQNEAALKVLEPLLAANQTDPDLLSLASGAYEAIGDTPKAVPLLRQAIVLNPADAEYYLAFAALCLDHDSFEIGIDMMTAGLLRIPNEPSLYISRGLLYAQTADYDKAEADFNTAERLDSRQSVSVYTKDIVELQRDMSDKTHPEKALSLSDIRTQLRDHPDSAFLHFLLARLLVDEKPGAESDISGEAMKSALQAVKLKPDFIQARDLLASMYMSSGQYTLAVEQCRRALEYAPTDRSALYHLIIALRHSGQSGKSDEIQVLVKRLTDLQQVSLQQETARKRFKLLERQPDPQK